MPIDVTVSLRDDANEAGEWGQIDLRDAAGVGCTYSLSYTSPEQYEEFRDERELPDAEDGELVYMVDSCIECIDRWIDLPLVFIRLTDQGDLEVTPFFFSRNPSFTLAAGGDMPSERESELAVDPTTAARGQEFSVSVVSFVANRITMEWYDARGDWHEVHLGDVETGSDGNGTFVFSVPLGVPDGSATVLAEGRPASNYCGTLLGVDMTVAGGPTELSLAGISVFKHVDTDGDLDTFEDIQSPRSWEFQATFEDGVEIISADPNTSRDEPAGWLIGHTGESTRVVVTEVPQDGYRLVKASCIDVESDVGAEIMTSLDGNSLSFEVSGFGPIAPWPHGYYCDFLNARVSDAALPTLPPTDVGVSPARGPGPSPVLLLLFATTAAGVFVWRTHRPTHGRTSG